MLALRTRPPRRAAEILAMPSILRSSARSRSLLTRPNLTYRADSFLINASAREVFSAAIFALLYAATFAGLSADEINCPIEAETVLYDAANHPTCNRNYSMGAARLSRTSASAPHLKTGSGAFLLDANGEKIRKCRVTQSKKEFRGRPPAPC
jgi:hypothetical protein